MMNRAGGMTYILFLLVLSQFWVCMIISSNGVYAMMLTTVGWNSETLKLQLLANSRHNSFVNENTVLASNMCSVYTALSSLLCIYFCLANMKMQNHNRILINSIIGGTCTVDNASCFCLLIGKHYYLLYV